MLLLIKRCGMHNTTELRDSLADLAESVVPTEGYEARILQRAGRRRGRRRVAAGAAAAVCVAVLLTMFRAVGLGPTPQLAAPPPDGPFLGWSAVGNVDADLVREATSVWGRTNSAGPHTDVRALVATRHPRLRSTVVVLQGYDKQGDARLAFFTGDAGAADALRLRVDRPAPDPVSTRVLSLVSPRLSGASGEVGDDSAGTYAIALAMPGVTAVRVSSTAVDDEMTQDPDGPTGRLVVKRFPIAATAQTTTIAGFIKQKRPFASMTKVFEVPGEGGVDGDARAVPAEVVGRNGQQMIVAFAKDQGVRRGQLAVVAAGLVGRVTAVDPVRGEATVELVTSTGFAGPAYTAISNVAGSVRGTGGKLVMEGVAADGEVYQTNRVLMPDPSQQDDQVGAVTIGRASADKAEGATTVELTPTADLTNLTSLSIMTPPTAVSVG
ncbi:rod shape-determining protein MreC [Micromonospora sp. CA-249363]|uniref:rod shape-determining protein MreC n=1 Tax=Micromonospora sp. CA-249363 TaxID=3239963 RepID=UPI003D8DEE89